MTDTAGHAPAQPRSRATTASHAVSQRAQAPVAGLARALILTFDDERARDAALALAPLRALSAAPLPHARLALPIPDETAERRLRATLRALGFAAED